MTALVDPLPESYLTEIAEHFAALNPPYAPPTPTTLAPDQIEELRALFCIYDTDGSGMIDMEELLEALPSVGYSESEFRSLFQTYDADKNGLLDVEEFLSLMADVFQ
jgi:calmodulin